MAVLGGLGLLALAGLFLFLSDSGLSPDKQEQGAEFDLDALRGLVQEQVGGFTLQEGTEEQPEDAQLGTNGSLIANYAGTDGNELEHRLFATPSPEDADDLRQRFVGAFTAIDPNMEVQEQPVEAGGEEVGTATMMQQVDKNGAAVVWSNGALAAVANADGEDPESFYESVPY